MGPPAPVKVHIALHTGVADMRGSDYYGSAVNRCAQLFRLIGKYHVPPVNNDLQNSKAPVIDSMKLVASVARLLCHAR